MEALRLIAMVAVLNTALGSLYEQHGEDWQDPLCQFGQEQSPIDIQTGSAETSGSLSYEISYQSLNNLTVEVDSELSKIFIDYSSTQGQIDFWAPNGQHFLFYQQEVHWKVPSEHQLDGKQFAAELQIVHNQYASNRKLIISILFDYEVDTLSNGKKAKSCFANAFKLGEIAEKAGDIEIPIKELLDYLPKDFYFYEGSLTEPPCYEVGRWILMAEPFKITEEQVDLMKELLPEPFENNRAIQLLQERTIYYSINNREEYLASLMSGATFQALSLLIVVGSWL